VPTLDPAIREALEARLRFYRELGLTDFYRRPVETTDVRSTQESGAPSLPEATVEEENSGQSTLSETTSIPPRKSIPSPPPISTVSAEDRVSALQILREEIGDCTRCALHKGRNKLVFADGDPYARLMFVGEGPGADEDAQGLPFVGRAGQLLNNMIGAMGLKREQVYIANVVKCRPPQNRTPEPDEANTCSPFLSALPRRPTCWVSGSLLQASADACIRSGDASSS
jgi:uracil-DNA glycosylase